MTRPLAYITAPWGEDHLENATLAANYCRQAYEAGYSPICPVLFMPTFLKGDAPAEVKDRKEMSDELLKRSRILIVCGDHVNDEVKSDIALAKHCLKGGMPHEKEALHCASGRSRCSGRSHADP